ncbi:MAG: peptidylprolyl isomerase [Planctomycetota bacterium]
MLVSLICLFLAAPEPPELPVRPGSEIVLDSRVEKAEWQDAFSVGGKSATGGDVRFYLKRNGPWLALALTGEGAYGGEILRLYTADEHGAWFTNLVFGIGQPALPPALWRRGPAAMLQDARTGEPECPRACRARVNVMGKERWSAEYLVRISALGIGRADPRDMRARFTLGLPRADTAPVIVLPASAADPLDLAGYARLAAPDTWGAAERWAPVSADVSREFDDNELLYRLFREHDKITARDEPSHLVIHNAVRPRSMLRINRLREQLEQGRKRNPTLPAWTYFLGRLLNEANLYAAARRVVEAIPEPLRGLDPFASLAAEHYNDTMEFEKAVEICRANPRMPDALAAAKFALAGRRARAAEQEALKKDAAKDERNPQVRIVTEKGDIVCELFEDDAPHAVRNFMDLALKRKYYDKLGFHLVLGGIAAHVGDPRSRPGAVGDKDGPDWRLRIDKSRRPLLRGYLATVTVEGGASHGSEFILSLAPLLDRGRQAAVFGRVVEGQDVLESLEQDDRLERIEVIRKRNHLYDPVSARYER